MPVYFEEQQYFDQSWLRGLLIVLAIFDAVAFKHGTILISGGLLFLTYVTYLQTQVSDTGIRFRFYPFMKWKEIPFQEIQDAYIREYQPLLEYGGWGVRWGFGARAYNVKGRYGLQLILKNGKKILIGTQQAETLDQVLKKLEP